MDAAETQPPYVLQDRIAELGDGIHIPVLVHGDLGNKTGLGSV